MSKKTKKHEDSSLVKGYKWNSALQRYRPTGRWHINNDRSQIADNENLGALEEPADPTLGEVNWYVLACYFLQYLAGVVKLRWEDQAWMVWNGMYWEITHAEQNLMLAVRDIIGELLWSSSPEKEAELILWLNEADDYKRLLETMKIYAERISAKEMTPKPSLLCLANGVFDLEQREFRKPRREDYLLDSAIMPVDFNPQEQAPTWMRFLKTLVDGDEASLVKLQCLCGQALGDIDQAEGTRLLLWGAKLNGGALFLRTIQRIFGTYAGCLPASFLTADQTLNVSSLRDKRLLTLAGIDWTQPVPTARLAAWFAGAPLTSYCPHAQQWLDYRLSTQVLVLTDQKPTWLSSDQEVAMNIYPIKIEGYSKLQPGFENIETDLRKETAGIFNWLIQGYYAYHQDMSVMRTLIRVGLEKSKT